MATHEQSLEVTEWGTPPVQAGKPHTSIYIHKLEVIRHRNKTEPDLWGIIARFSSRNSAQSRASLERKRNRHFELACAQDESDASDDWLVWARVIRPEDRVRE
jgi:hypothetical protein